MRKKLALMAILIAMNFAMTICSAATQSIKGGVETLIESAKSQQDRGQYKIAESNYRKALSIDPLQTNAITGLIELYRQQGMAAKVQLTIAQLTPAQRDALGTSLKHIEVTMLQDQSDIRLAKGQTDQAIKYLEQAVQVDSDDPALHFKLANLYASRIELSKGRLLLEDFQSRHPDDPEAQYMLAQYLSDRGDTRNALKHLNQIDPVKLTTGMISMQQRLTFEILAPEIESRIKAGKRQEAIELLSEAETFTTASDEQLMIVAFGWAEIGEVAQGRNLYDKVQNARAEPLTFNGLNTNSRNGLIRILIASGNRDQALQQMDAWAALPSANDIQTGSKLANTYADLGEYPRAKTRIDAVLAAHPETTYVLYDAWKIAQRTGHTDDEIDYLKKLVIAEPSQRQVDSKYSAEPANKPDTSFLTYENIGTGIYGSESRIQRDWKENRLARLIDRRSRWLSSALDVRNRTGTAGLSEFHSVEIPIEYKTTWHIDDEVYFRADLVKLNTGNVVSTSNDFGSMLLCPAACGSAPLNQEARGVSVLVGYQHNEISMDIGSTPQAFPVSNIVGGIQHKGDLGEFGYSLETSRRPITASLLSFAGTKDPNTGKVWGGVVATGGRLGLSLDAGGTFGFWSSIGLHSLTGRNVLTNQRLQFMAGEQWRVINEGNRRLVIGLTGMYWDFSENAGEYSFGHGGYYSPHNYRSLALPISYMARSPRFSYLLRAAISASRSQTRAGLFYPTDPALQSQAVALGSVDPTYAAGTSGGRGYSLRAAWEYQATPQLFIGGLFAMDRSDFYAPNQALLYLRYSIDHPGAQPVFLPPEPVEPSSQFY